MATPYIPKDMTGTLFKNDKGDNERRPDYRGDISVGGTVYKLAAWIKEGAKGKFMSLSIQPKDEQQAQRPAASLADMDDDIPF